MRIAITGHRPNKLGNDYNLTSPLVQRIKQEIIGILSHYNMGKGDDRLITGMALGIDTLFAQIAIEHEIPFIAAIPCAFQDSKWSEKSRNTYQQITSNKLCTPYWVSKESYNSTCMQVRNEWMVDNSDRLIAVWDGTSGGTANCVQYAESKSKFIIRINPNDFK